MIFHCCLSRFTCRRRKCLNLDEIGKKNLLKTHYWRKTHSRNCAIALGRTERKKKNSGYVFAWNFQLELLLISELRWRREKKCLCWRLRYSSLSRCSCGKRKGKRRAAKSTTAILIRDLFHLEDRHPPGGKKKRKKDWRRKNKFSGIVVKVVFFKGGGPFGMLPYLHVYIFFIYFSFSYLSFSSTSYLFLPFLLSFFGSFCGNE